jgi:hypothetical protein
MEQSGARQSEGNGDWEAPHRRVVLSKLVRHERGDASQIAAVYFFEQLPSTSVPTDTRRIPNPVYIQLQAKSEEFVDGWTHNGAVYRYRVSSARRDKLEACPPRKVVTVFSGMPKSATVVFRENHGKLKAVIDMRMWRNWQTRRI